MTKWEAWNTLAEDEKHWENSFEKGLLKAEYLDGFRLRLWFEEDLDVAIYELDFYPLLFEENPGEDLLPLRDPERFQFVEGNYALIWPNPETGYDIHLAPECVRFMCKQYGKELKPTNQRR